MQNPNTTKPKKWPAGAGWLIGYAAVLALAAGLVYFWRVVFFLPAAFPAAGATLAVAGVFTLLYAVAFLLCRMAKWSFALKAAMVVFAVGLLFCFATAPLQAPDEDKHFLRANAISHGRFTYDATERFTDDVGLLVELFAAPMNHKVTYQGAQLAANAVEEYGAALAAGEGPDQAAESPIMFMLLPFLHQALFMAAARLVGFSALGQLYAGRMANLLLYALLCWLALKKCRQGRGVLLAFMLLPVSLFMAASCSYDGLMLALCWYLFGFLGREEIDNKALVGFAMALAVANYIKPLNFLLAGLLLLIPKQRFRLTFRWQGKRWVWAAVAAVCAVALWLGMDGLDGGLLKQNWDTLPRGSGDASNPGAQMLFVVSHPLRFLAVCWQSICEANGFLFDLGRLGAMDMVVPLAGGLSVLLLCAAVVLAVREEDDTKPSVLLGLCVLAVLYAGAVLSAMYVMDTDWQSIRVTGQQPRYFLPALLALFWAAWAGLGKLVRPRRLGVAQGGIAGGETALLCAAALVAVFCAVLLFQGYFIGQWIPKAEGGWKLVNLYGWVQT